MAKLRVWLLVLLAVAPITSGCWDRREVNDLAIVLATAIDKAPDGIRVTVEVVQPAALSGGGGGGAGGISGGGGGGSPSKSGGTAVLSATGANWAQAVTALQRKTSRTLFWAHSRVLLLGEDLARQGVLKWVDFPLRFRELRPSIEVMVTRGPAYNVLGAAVPLESAAGEFVRELLRQAVGPHGSAFHTFLEDLLAPGIEPMLPALEVVPTTQETTRGAGQTIHLNGAGIFRGDRLVGFMDDATARGLLWVLGFVKESTVTDALPQGDVSFRLLRARTRIRAVNQGGQPVIQITLDAEDDLLENQSSLDLSKPAVIRILSNDLARLVRDRALAAIAAAQGQFKADVLGFGRAVRRYQPQLWQQVGPSWDARFPSVPVEITVRAAVRRPGLATQSPVKEGK